MNRIVVLCGMLFLTLPSVAQRLPVSARDSIRIKQLFFAGLSDKLKENYVKSNENFTKITAIDAGNAAAWYEIALLNFRQNKMPEAETAIATAVNIDKNNPWYWKLMAELYKSTGSMDRLIPVFDQLIRLAPDQQSYQFDRANAIAISGRKEEALTAYALVEKKFGPSEALTRARQRITAGPQEIVAPVNATEAMAAATLFLSQKKFMAASKVLENIASTHQDDPLFLALYGDVLYETGNLPAALEHYKKALKLTDQLYGVWEKVLNISILMGQYKQMIGYGEAALAVYPNQAILYYYMAFALHREDQNKEALTHIKSAMMLDGENKELQALISALQAEILIDQGKVAAADQAFEKAVGLDPQNFLIMNNYAYYLALRNENLDKAEALITVAAKALPRDASVADTYALILLKKGKYELAKVWIEKSLQNNEAENSVYLEHYGDILFHTGSPDEALVQWKKSWDAGNDSPLLKRKINEKKYLTK
ncbi:tetratricopeptide (TPR) repeat protein [Pedobacter cryoconitis]|uniref:Tetratricopeptide (TPR) repeat protein n=1 Tax=Pedobacter cryoconitis TaxID=188932 RepID=A0A7W8YZ50_9SPHI|nr:tetratricopeptide repeat protein [Pedobacter cryoconitis]MBB5624193.1 tetratricopeptide (TPR) repeat protein [Pedobacter cryoconitis]